MKSSVSSLGVFDSPEEHSHPRWDQSIAATLERAYRLLAGGDAASAADVVRPYVSAPMGDLQRIRVLYISSLGAGNRLRWPEAFTFVEEALDLAVAADDLETCATLAYQGAVILHKLQRFVLAAEYYDIALDALRSKEDLDPIRSAPREFDLLVGLAIEHFYLARLDMAEDFLAAAVRLPLEGQHHELRSARIAMLAALLARSRGNYTGALKHALIAHDIFQKIGSAHELIRMRTSLAGIYLDFAAPEGTPSTPSDRGRIVQLAELPILHALADSRATGDRSGEALALLLHARYIRAAGRDESALGIISQAEDMARRQNEVPTLAIAYTVRGAELIASGKIEQAISSFREAIELVDTTEVPILAVSPRRALLAAEELLG
jgi:tetratricopeptide (TPR) repeat protein